MVTDLVEHAYMEQARLLMKILTSPTMDRVCLAWLYVLIPFYIAYLCFRISPNWDILGEEFWTKYQRLPILHNYHCHAIS